MCMKEVHTNLSLSHAYVHERARVAAVVQGIG